MAGGLGKRFWPVSTIACPKQFCDILNVGKSFLRQTFERANQIFDTQNIFIVTGTAYEELTKQQIPEIPSEKLWLRIWGHIEGRKRHEEQYNHHFRSLPCIGISYIERVV